MNRREADQSRLSHLLVRPDWLARRSEAALDPGLPIIDPHHHLWDRPRTRYLIDELAADIGAPDQGGHNVVATVFVQCGAMYRAHGPEELKPVGETEFVAGQGAMADSGLYGSARCNAAIICHIDLTLGDDVARVIDAMRKFVPAGSVASGTPRRMILLRMCGRQRPIHLPVFSLTPASAAASRSWRART